MEITSKPPMTVESSLLSILSSTRVQPPICSNFMWIVYTPPWVAECLFSTHWVKRRMWFLSFRLHEGLLVQHLLHQQWEPVRHHQRCARRVQTLREQLRGDEIAGSPWTHDPLLLRRHHHHDNHHVRTHQERLRHGYAYGQINVSMSLLRSCFLGFDF